MQSILALIVVIGILSSIANKKRKEQMRKARQAPPQPQPFDPLGQTTSPKKTETDRPSASAAAQKTQKSTPGVDTKWPWPTAAERAQGKNKPATPTYGGTPRYTHVVTSTLEGGHTHTESSMTGEESCPPPKSDMKKPLETGKNRAVQEGAPLLSFQTNSVLQGVLYSEILGKPKALKRI